MPPDSRCQYAMAIRFDSHKIINPEDQPDARGMPMRVQVKHALSNSSLKCRANLPADSQSKSLIFYFLCTLWHAAQEPVTPLKAS